MREFIKLGLNVSHFFQEFKFNCTCLSIFRSTFQIMRDWCNKFQNYRKKIIHSFACPPNFSIIYVPKWV